MYTGDYKLIEVIAYDDDGDIFSDLDGFRFDWSIVSGHEYIKITDKPEGIRHQRESQSDVAFLRGLAAGPAEISVQIKEPGYDYIKSVSVKIQVVDPFILEPHREVYILPTSSYDFKIHKLVRDKDGAINQETQALPSPRYTLGVANKTLGIVEQSGRYISDVHEGVQHITAIDQLMTNNTAEAWLNVVHPYRLTVSIHDVTSFDGNLPGKDHRNLAQWFGVDADTPSESRVLVEDHLYLVLLTLTDIHDHKIEMTDNIELTHKNFFQDTYIEKV